MTATREIRLPALSATMEEATLIQWLVQPGDDIREGQPIAEVSTDKVDMEMEAPFAGTIAELTVPDGAVVPLGAVMALVRTDAIDLLGDLAFGDDTQAEAGVQGTGENATAVAAATTAVDAERAHGGSTGTTITPASPPARKLASRLGIDLRSVPATGARGQVTPADVQRHVDASRPASTTHPGAALHPSSTAPPFTAAPANVPDAPGRQRESVRKATAAIMSSSFTIPQFTLYRQLRLDKAAAGKGGESWTTIIVRALAAGLRVHPELNMYWRSDSDDVAPFDTVRVGVAVDRPGVGLVVTSISEPDAVDLDSADQAVRGAIDRARTGRLRPDDLAQASITISNLGGMGVESFNALLFPPQPAIVSVGSIAMRPVATADGALKAALTCTIGLTVDHRVADGADGARYLETVTTEVERRT